MQMELQDELFSDTDEDSVVRGPFTDDFVEWLDSNSEFGSRLFVNNSLMNRELNTFGGKENREEKITKTPIIFFHGNGDGALRSGEDEFGSGWSDIMLTFTKHGYKPSSMYAYTYGDRDMKTAYSREMRCNLVVQANRFIAAVLEYTGAKQVDVIGHSMGVSIARKAIIGGRFIDDDENCPEFEMLNDRVRNFVSISGAHYGMCLCTKDLSIFAKACGQDFGFYSGGRCDTARDQVGTCSSFKHVKGECKTEDYSLFLKDINDREVKEGERILSIWSENDEVIGPGNFVWGRKTSRHPYSDKEIIFFNKTHHQTKNDAGIHIYNFINENFFF
uniref:Lipase n=1 Tax=Strongyloides papillosus TaxID=174720 RepID=A0A0N5BR56_STREA